MEHIDMVKQSDIFLQGEGQAWYERNKDKLPPEHDPVMEAIEKASIIPNNVLEFGASTGWRLDALWRKYGCNVQGIDPFGRGMNVREGTAADWPYVKWKERFDLVIYGFCLYLVDREDLFTVTRTGDFYLQEGGYLIIHDFHPDYPHKVKYKHKEGLFSYKMDHAQLWLANPAYKLRSRVMCAEETSVTILHKDIGNGWPIKE